MGEMMTFALFLFKRLRNAEPKTRQRLRTFLQEFKDTGAIPLGMHEDTYWWVVYNPNRFASPKALEDHLTSCTPPGLKKIVLTI